jgi:hypothetical protein
MGPKSKSNTRVQKAGTTFKKYAWSSKRCGNQKVVQKPRIKKFQKVIYSIKKPAPKSKSNSGSKSWVQKPKRIKKFQKPKARPGQKPKS